MNHVKIKAQSLKDEKVMVFPELSRVPRSHFGPVTHVQILEGGMKSGKSSVMVCSVKDDKIAIIELSAAELDGINAAVQGAIKRWEKPYFNSDQNMVRCDQCGSSYLRGTMCYKCF